MFDSTLRTVLAPALDRAAALLDRPGVTPDRLTVLGLMTGLASAATAAAQWWWWSLALWLVSRLLDGLDGALARRRHREAPGIPVPVAGGFLDITADFVVYGSTALGVAVGATAGQGAAWQPFAAVLLAYYINGTAFLAFSSAAERSGRQIEDGRSFSFLGGLAEGTETIAVHTLWLVVPAYASLIAGVWAGVVAISAGQRMVSGYRLLRSPSP